MLKTQKSDFYLCFFRKMSGILYSWDALTSANEIVTTLPSIPIQDKVSIVTTSWALEPLFQQFQAWFPFFEGLSQFEIIAILTLALVWIFAAVWTLRDAMARSESVGFQFFAAILVVLFSPVIGLPVYLAIRPLTYRWERGYWKEVLQANAIFCPHCENLVDPKHKACVYCGESLKTSCKECEAQYYRGYFYCPECWAPNID